jgi:hypothetical protein
MKSLHQHLGEFLPLETPLEDALLPPITNPRLVTDSSTNSNSAQEFDFQDKEEENPKKRKRMERTNESEGEKTRRG